MEKGHFASLLLSLVVIAFNRKSSTFALSGLSAMWMKHAIFKIGSIQKSVSAMYFL